MGCLVSGPNSRFFEMVLTLPAARHPRHRLPGDLGNRRLVAGRLNRDRPSPGSRRSGRVHGIDAAYVDLNPMADIFPEIAGNIYLSYGRVT